MRLKTKFWAKDMRIIKDSYRENYDKIRWGNRVDRYEWPGGSWPENPLFTDDPGEYCFGTERKCDADKTGEE